MSGVISPWGSPHNGHRQMFENTKHAENLYSGFGENWPKEDIENRIRANLKAFCDMGYKCKVVKVEEKQEAI